MARLQSYCLVIYFSVFVMGTASDGILTIKLIHFENTKSLLPDGTCCDEYDETRKKCYLCEYSFRICASGDAARRCSICDLKSDYVHGGEYLLFDSEFYVSGTNIGNPIKLNFGRWNGTLAFGITAYDDDSGGFDVVSNMAQNISINATQFGLTQKTMVALEGEKRSDVTPKLTAEISAICNKNFLIPTCSDYCVDTDDATGHYTCNYVKGIRECLSGWYGDKCNNKVVLCTPRNDSQGHYDCDKITGEKICLPGWKNATLNCTEAINIKPTTSISSTTILQKHSSSQPVISSLFTATAMKSIHITVEGTASSTAIKPKPSSTIGMLVASDTAYTKTTGNLKTSTKVLGLYITPTITSKIHYNTVYQTRTVPDSSLRKDFFASAAMSPATSISLAVTAIIRNQNTSKTAGSLTASLVIEKATVSSPIAKSFVATLLPSKSSDHKTAPGSSINAVKPTKDVIKTSPQPTKEVTKTTKTDKRFDYSKLMAVGVSTFILIALLVTVLALLIKKNRAHRVQPISLSARYKQSSARFTASARPSISSTNRSAPSVRGIAETRFESRPYMTQPYNPTPSPFRGMTETRIDSSPYANTTQFDQRSTNSGNRSQGIRTRDSSGRSLQGGREFQNQNNKIESLISRHDSSHIIIPNQAFLMVPYAGNKKLSL